MTPNRFEAYMKNKTSASMMDHYFDKLLHIAVYDPKIVQNSFLEQEAARRVQPLIDICLQWGRTGEVPVDLIKSFM